MHANPNAKQPIAIIIPHEQNLRHALESKSLGLPAHTVLPDLCKDDRIREFVMKECNAVGKKNGFKPMEILESIILTADEWTPESGLVTAAQKVQRRKVAEHYGDEIKVCVGAASRGVG